MSVSTHDRTKVGTEAYRVTIGRDDGNYIDTIKGCDFPTVRLAEKWGLARVRELAAMKDGYEYDARIEHVRWVADQFEDEEYGLVLDATIEYDMAFNSYFRGVTWQDDHDPDGPMWEK